MHAASESMTPSPIRIAALSAASFEIFPSSARAMRCLSRVIIPEARWVSIVA